MDDTLEIKEGTADTVSPDDSTANAADASPPAGDEKDVEAIDHHAAGLISEDEYTDTERTDIHDLGLIVGERITSALSTVYGDEKAELLCSEIAAEARDSDRPIQDIITDKVAEASGIELDGVSQDVILLPTQDTDTASENRYEALKERYDNDRGKYLFRNTFVCLERLELNLEAYKSGRDGDKGQPVSGGDIAMNVIELTRSNVWESIFEIAVRNYFDSKYPAKVDTGTTTEEAPDIEPRESTRDNLPDLIYDVSGTIRDDGLVTSRSIDLQELGISKGNPAAGQYMGVDMTKQTDERMSTISMAVWRSGRGINDTVTVDGKAETFRIPDLRLVELNGDHYLVDPFGKTLASDIDPASGKDTATYFKSLDISSFRWNTQIMEAAADGKGVSVDQYKEQIAETVKAGFTERLVEGFDKHTVYLNDLIPDIKQTVEAYREKIETLSTAEAAIQRDIARIDALPPDVITAKDETAKTAAEVKLGQISDAKEKLAAVAEKMEIRVEKLEATIKGYAEAKAAYQSDKTDVDASFSTVLKADMDAVGKTGNEDYGLAKEDLDQIADTLEAVRGDVDRFEPPPTNNVANDEPKSEVEAIPGKDSPQDLEAQLDRADSAEAAKPADGTSAEPVQTAEQRVEGAAANDSSTKVEAVAPADAITTDSTEESPGKVSADEAVQDSKAESGRMEAYRPAPYDGPQPATIEDWKAVQLDRIRECVYEIQSEGTFEKQDILNRIEDLGYAELDKQADWLQQNVGTDVSDVTSDYNGMKDSIATIDSRLEAADRFLAVLDNPEISSDEKIFAFRDMAENMGFREDTLESVFLESPTDVETQSTDAKTDAEPAESPVERDTPLPDPPPEIERVQDNSTPTTKPDDDAAAVEDEESSAPVGYEDIKAALDKFLEQDPDGVYSFKEDFLDAHADQIAEQDLYGAFADKVAEIEEDVKKNNHEVGADLIERLSDVFNDIEDTALSSITYQVEHLTDLVDAVCGGDWDSVGNLLMESYFDKLDAQLSPLEKIADYLNDKFDPEWQADTEAIKEAVCDKLDHITSEGIIDRVCDIAESLNDIFHGFDIMLGQIGESYASSDQVDQYETAQEVDVAVSETDHSMETHVDEAIPDIEVHAVSDEYEPDVDLSTQVDTLRDFFADVEAAGASAESAATAEEMEAAIAAL